MEKLRSFLLAFLMLIGSITVSAYDIEVDGIYYYLNTSSHEATVTYKAYDNDGYTYLNDYSGDILIPTTISVEGVVYSITSIGNYAFLDCSGLTSINIPDGVTSIGDRAFYGCSGLTSINVPDGVTSIGNYAFSGCSGLTSINIPDGVTSIGDDAFYGCSGLTSINVPDGVTSIEGGAFYGCSGLTSINIPDGVTSIKYAAFSGCSGLTSINIPDGITSIGDDAFRDCSGLTSINIPDGVTSIEGGAFYGCSGLTSITIPDSVTSIGNSAFSYCSGLTAIVVKDGNEYYDSRNNCNAIIETATNTLIMGYKNTIIPNSVTSIGDEAFGGCSDLTDITIPGSVTSIGDGVFFGCSSLTDIVVEEGNKYYDSRNNCNAIIETATNTLITGCRNSIIPNSVTSIGNCAFNSCSSLTDIIIPNSVTSIGYGAFGGCGLTEVTIPNSVTSIEGSAFYSCYRLTDITISEGITNIGEWAFAFCSSLQSVKMLSPTPPTASENILEYCPEVLVIYVPIGTKENYDVAPWNYYRVVEMYMEDEPAGIGSLETETRDLDIYDLNGRKVLQPTKGVYIINGKKVMIK